MNTLTRLPRLLAIDDDADSAELMARVAGRAGYDVAWETDPKRAADAVSDFGPDILTLDLCMPEMDALDVIAMLRDAGFQGRLMLVSGQPDGIRDAAARLAEANGFEVAASVRKPVDVAAMRRRLFGLANEVCGEGTAIAS